MRFICSAFALAMLGAWAGLVCAETTGVTGGSQPQTTIQPTLAIDYYMPLESAVGHMGDIGMFAGNFGPNGSPFVQGQLLPVSQYDSLFGALGTNFGGDGVNSFALPDLRGRVPVGVGSAPGLSDWTLGEKGGVETVPLSVLNLPAHGHTLLNGLSTDSAGSGLAYTNVQPSLGLNYMIALQGTFPPRDGGSSDGGVDSPFYAQIVPTARSTAPNGWAFAQGQLLAINQNQALFSILGTTYGGDGRVTFALPDLRGRAVIGAGQGPGPSNHVLGEKSGVETVSLLVDDLPAHDHTLPPSSEWTGITGGGQSETNMQPTLALNYIIATQGIFPPRDGDGSVYGDDPFFGQISIFAGNYAPAGWAFCDGSLIQISQNTPLFSLLGTFYGGDGKSTFALPDLRGRVAVSAGQGPGLSDWTLGQMDGVETLILTEAQMAAHAHDYTPVPEPATIALLLVGAFGVLSLRRRSR